MSYCIRELPVQNPCHVSEWWQQRYHEVEWNCYTMSRCSISRAGRVADCRPIVERLCGIAAESSIVAQSVHGSQREVTITTGRYEVEHARIEKKICEFVLPTNFRCSLDANRRRQRGVFQWQSFGYRTPRRAQLYIQTSRKCSCYLRRSPNCHWKMSAVFSQNDQRADVLQYHLDMSAGDDV